MNQFIDGLSRHFLLRRIVKSILIAASLAGIFTLGATAQVASDATTARDAYYSAAESFENGDYQNAAAYLDRATELRGATDAFFLTLDVKIKHKLKQYEAAEAAYFEFESFDPSEAQLTELAPIIADVRSSLEQQREKARQLAAIDVQAEAEALGAQIRSDIQTLIEQRLAQTRSRIERTETRKTTRNHDFWGHHNVQRNSTVDFARLQAMPTCWQSGRSVNLKLLGNIQRRNRNIKRGKVDFEKTYSIPVDALWINVNASFQDTRRVVVSSQIHRRMERASTLSPGAPATQNNDLIQKIVSAIKSTTNGRSQIDVPRSAQLAREKDPSLFEDIVYRTAFADYDCERQKSEAAQANDLADDPLISKRVAATSAHPLGIALEEQGGELIVALVNPNGRGARGQLKTGDVILSINNQIVRTKADFDIFLPKEGRALLKVARPVDTSGAAPAEFAETFGLNRQELFLTVDLSAAPIQSVTPSEKPKLGVAFNLYDGRRILIAEVLTDSIAANAGLRPGDFVDAIDGREVNSDTQFLEIIGDTTAGQTRTFQIDRGGEKSSVDVIFGKARDEPGEETAVTPVALKKVQPKIPAEFLQGNHSGYCQISFDINPGGYTKNVQAVTCTNPLLAAPSIAAVEQWEYQPHLVGGVPTMQPNINTQITFRIAGDSGEILPYPDGF